LDNLLKKQLEQIKKRAQLLRQKGECREGVRSTAEPTPEPGISADSVSSSTSSNEIVNATLASGAVTRGGEFDKLRSLRRRWPWRRNRDESNDDATRAAVSTAAEWEHPLEAFKKGEPLTIEQAATGTVHTIDDDTFYMVRPVGIDVDPDAPREARLYRDLHAWPEDVNVSVAGMPRTRRSKDQEELPQILFDPRRALFLDIETAGLSANTYLFLIGVMFLEGDDFVVEQLFARDYAEEVGVLKYLNQLMSRFDNIVTYNGASFDMPFIRTRMAIHRIPDIGRFGSVDLLHTARTVFRDVLPNHRLVTVEKHLRKVDRQDDIPSRYIPEAYHDYVASGNARAMRNVLYHNRMDLFTMAVIVNRLAEREYGPEQ